MANVRPIGKDHSAGLLFGDEERKRYHVCILACVIGNNSTITFTTCQPNPNPAETWHRSGWVEAAHEVTEEA